MKNSEIAAMTVEKYMEAYNRRDLETFDDLRYHLRILADP